MRGGRLIGQGKYGCIFDPPLICRGDQTPIGGWKKGTLGKLTSTEDIASEFLAATRFKDKPESRKYFILPQMDTLCKEGPHGESPIEQSAQKEPDISKCEVVQKEGMDNMLHYQMEYGGKTLQDKLENIQIAAKEFPFFRFMGDLLEIGAYLALNGMVHNDLHSANIMMNKEYHPRLIDFGRCYAANSITPNILKNLAAIYEPSLGQITPECSAQDGLESGMKLSVIMHDLTDKKPGLIYAERLFGQSRQQQMAEFQHFWKTSKALQQNDYLTFWKLYWPVVDAWSIGHDLASTLYKLSMSNQFMKGGEWKQKYPVVKAVITGLLRASPRARLDCVEALALYDPMNSVVLSPPGKAWLAKKQEQREKIAPKRA
jgi:serine/threonine protein kinase